MPGDHFYTLDFHGEAAAWSGYEREGIAGYAFKNPKPNTVPIYRFYNPSTGDHFYTQSRTGESGPPAYKSEGIAWHMYKTSQPGTVPMYRWWSNNKHDHFYTTDATGELAPRSSYVAEGILGYLHKKNVAGTVPIYRWFNSNFMKRFTFSAAWTDANKHRLLERHSWAYYRAGLTDQLSGAEADLVRRLYQNETIHHEVITTPGINGSAIVGGRQISINVGGLFPQGDNEISQTLLHELMHCVGYTHPAKSGTPGDDGPYFSTAPLRAELAIAGAQSDQVLTLLADVAPATCDVVDMEAMERENAKLDTNMVSADSA